MSICPGFVAVDGRQRRPSCHDALFSICSDATAVFFCFWLHLNAIFGLCKRPFLPLLMVLFKLNWY